jgi:hypothetical protein
LPRVKDDQSVRGALKSRIVTLDVINRQFRVFEC